MPTTCASSMIAARDIPLLAVCAALSADLRPSATTRIYQRPSVLRQRFVSRVCACMDRIGEAQTRRRRISALGRWNPGGTQTYAARTRSSSIRLRSRHGLPKSSSTTTCSCAILAARIVKGISLEISRPTSTNRDLPQPVHSVPKTAVRRRVPSASFPLIRAQFSTAKPRTSSRHGVSPATSVPTAPATISSSVSYDTDTSEWIAPLPRHTVATLLVHAPTSFRPVDSGEMDYGVLPIVTMGARVSEIRPAFARQQYQTTCCCTGLGGSRWESTAEYWHHRIREEWGFRQRGRPSAVRFYPPAYEAAVVFVGFYRVWPDLEDKAKRRARAVRVTTSGCRVQRGKLFCQSEPDQPTSRSSFHHPSRLINSSPPLGRWPTLTINASAMFGSFSVA